MTSRRSLTVRLKHEALRLGFEAAGVARLTPSEYETFYRAWLAAGMHGEMGYLAREDAVAARTDPATRWPELRSALVVTMRYDGDGDGDAGGGEGRSGRPRGATGQLRGTSDFARGASHDVPGADRVRGESDQAGNVGEDVEAAGGRRSAGDPGRAIIARYARGRDYHKVVKRKLLALLDWLEAEVGHELPAGRAYVDTGPVLERELARRAGLGWFGRNTMLIHPRRGSYFFLGTLLTELELEPDQQFEREHCGTCNACVEACPTGALLGRDENGAPVMDARRCISYLTIELRGAIPRELRPLIGNRVFGCDICQEVCPYTRKFSRPSSDASFAARAPGEPPFGVQLEPAASRLHPGTASPPLVALLETALDEASWDSFSRGTAMRRAGRAGFARNVCVGLGNWASPDAVSVLARALSDPEPLVRAHAAWALGRVGSAEARAALSDRASVESDASVLEELSAAMDC